MIITNATLLDMERENEFVSIFGQFTETVLKDARLFPRLLHHRVVDVHGAWLKDLDRVGTNEKHLDEGLDHFKRCGHLAFWIRRMAPVGDAIDLTTNTGDAEGYPVNPAEQALRDLLFGYCNEYIAFELGFQICRFYERSKPSGSKRADVLLSQEYYKVMCHFLKYKTVSPHALYLTYKSLFFE